MLEHILF